MTARTTWEETYLLISVAQATRGDHGQGGWFCNVCDEKCGDLVDDLCPCCEAVYEDLEVEGDWRSATAFTVAELMDRP